MGGGGGACHPLCVAWVSQSVCPLVAALHMQHPNALDHVWRLKHSAPPAKLPGPHHTSDHQCVSICPLQHTAISSLMGFVSYICYSVDATGCFVWVPNTRCARIRHHGGAPRIGKSIVGRPVVHAMGGFHFSLPATVIT